MKNSLESYIESHPDWRTELAGEPYHLKIREHPHKPNRFMFSYDMIRSAMSSPIVQIARGIVIDLQKGILKDYLTGDNIHTRVVSRSFDKFFNYGEGNAAKIDWNGKIFAREKLDGSLIKYTFDEVYGEELWMTNNGFDARADLPCDLGDLVGGYETFQDLIDVAMSRFTYEQKQFMKKLGDNMTFSFELTSPYNRIVVPYTETELWLIGVRGNSTQEEHNPEEFLENFKEFPQFKTPKMYELTAKTLEEVIELVASLDSTHEGIVVCDENFNRIKIKGEQYVSIHRMKDNNGQLSSEHILKCIQAGTIDDILGIFPEYAEVIQKVVDKYHYVYDIVDKALDEAASIMLFACSTNDATHNKKAFALMVKDKPLAKLYFEFYKTPNEKQRIENEFMAKLEYDQMEKLCQGSN